MNKSDNLARALRTFEPAHEPYQRKRPQVGAGGFSFGQTRQEKAEQWLFMAVLTMFYVVALCVVLICGQITLAGGQQHPAGEEQRAFGALQRNHRLNLQLNSMMSLNNIETQATTRLGLSEPKQSQTQYIVVDRSNEVTRPEADDSWWDKLMDLLESMMEKITG